MIMPVKVKREKKFGKRDVYESLEFVIHFIFPDYR